MFIPSGTARENAMRTAIKVASAVMMLFVFLGGTLAQENDPPPKVVPARDLFELSVSDPSLSMFVDAVRASGLTRVLVDDNPLTVLALSDKAFASLSNEARNVLLTDPQATQFLLGYYILRQNITGHDAAEISTATTLHGTKLRTEIRGGVLYVNGAKLGKSSMRCANGSIFVLDVFDPDLVSRSLKLARTKH